MGELTCRDIRLIGLEGSLFLKLLAPVDDLISSTKEHKYKVLTKAKFSDTFEDIIVSLADNRNRKVLIVDDSNALLSVITLTDIMKVFAAILA